MNPPATATSLNQPFTGWDELRPGGGSAAWKIEKPEPAASRFVPFFPDQNGKVYEQLLHGLPVMLHCMDGTGRITSVNKQWTESFGYFQADVEGKFFTELLAPESRSHLVKNIYPKYLQSGVSRNEFVILMRKDGSPARVLLSMNAYRGDKGRIERSICMLIEPVSVSVEQPVTVVDDQRFKGAFESAAHGMALVSPMGKITLANAAFREFLGKSESDAAESAFDDYLHKEDRGQFLFAMGQLIKGEIPAVKQDLRYINQAGSVVHGSTSVSLVRGSSGDIEQLIVQIVDITQKKQAAQQFQQAQKMEAIGQLTGGLAHDFNNLLTVVIGNLQLIEGKLQPDERAQKRLQEAIQAASKGSDLTRHMLAFARKQALEPREVKVNDLVNGISPLIARTIGENIQLKAIAMAGEPKALIDPSQLESAILNLSINARDAMPDGGLLTIETQPVYLDAHYAAKYPEVMPGHYVMVAVSDTGGGMPPELLDKVFQPFFTTKDHGKGSGLGLSMVYGFIKQSGGHVSIYSEVGHGSSIKMYLPRRFAPGEEVPPVTAFVPVEPDTAPEPAAAAVVPEAAAEPVRPRSPKILVVEDQEAVRAVACGFLMDFGYDIIEAQDGFQAMARLHENPDIDLMFSDVVMPGGMNGFDLAQAAKAIRPSLKIVHTSGYPKGAMVHQEEPRFREGFIIMKPYRREDLQKIVKDALEFQE
ncbi:MAG: PAS domain S-box protein [Hyphomicrobiales bacterium]